MAENTEPRGVITAEEISTAHLCMEYGMRYGASAMRVSLSKSVMDSFTVLNGELDKVMHSADRSVFLYIFADGPQDKDKRCCPFFPPCFVPPLPRFYRSG